MRKPRVEGIYRVDRRIGQELLYDYTPLRISREKFFEVVEEDFDYVCFLSHIDYIEKEGLEGFSFVNIKPRTVLKYRDRVLRKLKPKIVLDLREDLVTPAELWELRRMREENPFLLSIDDFGCQGSNLDRIEILQPDFVKIDVNLLRFKGWVCFENLIRFLKDYTKAVLIAEKVETEEELRIALDSGVEVWSGFYEVRLRVRR